MGTAPCRHDALRALPRATGGQSLVEFTLVALLLFLLMFGIIDFGRMFFVQMTLQHALREAGRFAVTGNKLPDPDDPTRNLSRVDSIIQTARNAASGLDITGISVRSASGGANSGGGPGDTVTISLTSSVRLITPLIGQFFPNGQHPDRHQILRHPVEH